MDVIDLCDDENELVHTKESSTSLPCYKSFQSNNETATPKLTLISIEKLTKLEESKLKTAIKKTSRRKSVLHPLVHDNDSIEFMDIADSSSVTSPNTPDTQITSIDDDKTIKAAKLLLNLDDVPNPNLELMRRVAFLRVSIQHTLNELGQQPVKFENSNSWGHLRAQYIQNKKIKQKNSADAN